jgi:hypothetical protein
MAAREARNGILAFRSRLQLLCSLFHNSDLTENTQRFYEIDSVLLPICSVATAVKPTCRLCRKFSAWDCDPQAPFFFFDDMTHCDLVKESNHTPGRELTLSSYHCCTLTPTTFSAGFSSTLKMEAVCFNKNNYRLSRRSRSRPCKTTDEEKGKLHKLMCLIKNHDVMACKAFEVELPASRPGCLSPIAIG